jgi:outer membrane lipoprotein-sorting protein
MFRKLVLSAALVALPLSGAAAQQKTLEQVLQCHYDAIGGLKAWQDLNSMEAFGTMQGGGIQAPFVLYQKRPHMQRMEFTFQGMTGIQAFDGDTAWMIMPFAGSTDPELMPEDQAKQMRDEADIDGPLVDYKKKGVQVKLLGTEDVSGTQAYQLEVTLKNGDVRYYDLDTDYCLPIRVSGKREQGDQTIEFETIIGDYKPVDGLVMAHSIQTQAKGMPQASQTVTIDSVKVNPPIPDSLFSMPNKN